MNRSAALMIFGLVGIFSCQPLSAAESQIWGLGLKNCAYAVASAAPGKNGVEDAAIASWIEGYLSAASVYGNLDTKDYKEAVGFVKRACRDPGNSDELLVSVISAYLQLKKQGAKLPY